MKKFLHSFFIFLIFLIVGCGTTKIMTVEELKNKHQNSISINIGQLCTTWISFEKTSYSYIDGNYTDTLSFNNENRDTISFFRGGIFIIQNKVEKRSGLWELINDTTVLCNIASPVSKSVSVHLLSDSILTLTSYWGKEGENDIVKYRSSPTSITK